MQHNVVDDNREGSSVVDTPSQDPSIGNCLIMICNLQTECDYFKYLSKLGLHNNNYVLLCIGFV